MAGSSICCCRSYCDPVAGHRHGGPARPLRGAQSVPNPTGRDAGILDHLFWVMLAGALLLWLTVNGPILFVTRIAPAR